jgi:subtilase family serine protease
MAQHFAAPTVRIVDRIDEGNLVTLRGNTHPAANARNDLGRVSPTLPMTDLILVLSRDPAQQAAFDKFVANQYDSASPDFHQWLTPEQVGTNFGPAESDVASVTHWLTGHGFSIGEITKDRLSIRFSGTAAQVESAFHTEMHNLSVKGVSHIANMSDPQIPAALAPVVVGVKALHNFFPRPLHRMGSQVKLSREAGGWQRVAGTKPTAQHSSAAPRIAPSTSQRKAGSEFTINVPATGGTTSAYTEEDISPNDFATIYNVLPLWNKGIDGTGQTIAIAGTSDISQNDISTFRTFFGLPTTSPANIPQIVHPNPSLPGGDDPGICTAASGLCTIDDLLENSLDVEWSGAVAKNAQIVLVTAASQSATDDTLYDAESYIVDNVTAHVVSVSYGECELGEGTAGNTEYNTLWQKAASEGIAVFVAAGDSGAASCDQGGDASGVPYVAEDGLSVSGIASTPYNTAVGGTDFNWCPATDTLSITPTACPAAPYWSATNNANQSSAVGYVPEMPWNDTCANPYALQALINLAVAESVSGVNNTEEACNFLAETFNPDAYPADLVDTVGGGGGVSNCTASDGSTVASCTGGYPKPSWQTGVIGIPSDGKRDLPDVSFFSSDGLLTDSAYLICVEEEGSPCTYSTDAEPFASEVGGTSASTPPMAGVMALINQKTGAPQGFANPELYKLAATQTYSSCSAESVTASSTTCLFNDIDGGTFASPYTNAMPCDYGYNVSGVDSPNCKANNSLQGIGDPIGILPGYSSNVGYDLATGLGSLNVANLVNAWPAISGGAAVTVTVTPATTGLILSQTLAVAGTVASSAAGGATPTGTVTLTAGSYTSKATLASGAYSFTVPANSLGAGSDTLSVAYSGNTTYSTASGEAIVTVEGTGATFSLNSPVPAVTPAGGVAPGSASSAVVTVAAVAGYAGTVTVTCSLTTSPTGATDAPTCTGGGPTLTITLPNATAQTLSFTVGTTAQTTTTSNNLIRPRKNGWMGAGGGAVLAFLVFLGIPARRRSWRSMLGAMLLMAVLGSLAACGGGGGPSTTTTIDPGTSAGSYVFTVTGVGTPAVSPAVTETFTVVVN